MWVSSAHVEYEANAGRIAMWKINRLGDYLQAGSMCLLTLMLRWRNVFD
jgi:hypothetical protein